MGLTGIFCPACRTRLNVKDAKFLGKRITCPKCEHRFVADAKTVDDESAAKRKPPPEDDDDSPGGYDALVPAHARLPSRERKVADELPQRESRDWGAGNKRLWVIGGIAAFLLVVAIIVPWGPNRSPIDAEKAFDKTSGPARGSGPPVVAKTLPAEPGAARHERPIPPANAPSMAGAPPTGGSGRPPQVVIAGLGGDRLDSAWTVVNAGTASGWDHVIQNDRLAVTNIHGSNGYALVRLMRPVQLAGEFDSELTFSWKSQSGGPEANAAMQGLMLNFRDVAGDIVASCGSIDENINHFASPISAISAPNAGVGPDTSDFYMIQFKQAVPPSPRQNSLPPEGSATVTIKRSSEGILSTEFVSGSVRETLSKPNTTAIVSVELEFRRYVLDQRATFNGLTVDKFRLSAMSAENAAKTSEGNPAVPLNSAAAVPAAVPTAPAAAVSPSSARPARLLSGTPAVPDTSLDQLKPDDLRIVTKISGSDELRIFRDRAEWTHLSGAAPAGVTLNGYEWSGPEKQPLLNTGATCFLSDDAKLAGCTFVIVEGRGRVKFRTHPDHLQIQFDDDQPDAGKYELIVYQGLTLPELTIAPELREQVAADFRRFPLRELPTGRDLPTHKEFDKLRLEWRRSRLMSAYDRNGKQDPGWDAAARAFLEREAKLKPDPLPELIAAGEELINQGCDDPLVCYVHAHHLWRQKEAARAEPLALHAVIAFEKSKYPKRVTRFAPALLARIFKGQSPEKTRLGYGLLARSVSETIDVACEPFAPGEQRAFLAELDDDQGRGQLLEGNQQSLTRTVGLREAADPWLKHLLLAEYQIDQGWEGRGAGYSDTVTDEGWQAFAAGVEQARAHLLEARKLHPDYPEAAVGLIRATMAAGGIADETPRFWFDTAVAAQLDAPKAHGAMLTNLLPRWHGSHEQLLEFGLECLRSARFDTEVPRNLITAVALVDAEEGSPRKLLLELNASDAIEKCLAGYEHELAGDAAALAKLKTENLIMCWQRAWRDEAQRRLADLGDKLDAETLKAANVSSQKLRDDLLSSVDFSRLPNLRVVGKDFQLNGRIFSARLSRDGKMVATTGPSRGTGVQLVRLPSGNSQALALDPRCVGSDVQFSPQGNSLAALQYFMGKKGELVRMQHWGTVTVWKVGESSGRDLIPKERKVVEAMCWMPDERFIVIGQSTNALIYDLATATSVATTSGGPGSIVNGVAVSPDGTLLATGHRSGDVALWQVPPVGELTPIDKPRPLTKLFDAKQHGDVVIDVEFSADGKRFASGSVVDRVICLWSTETKTVIKQFDGRRLSFSPDGQMLVTCAGSTAEKRMVVWNAVTGQPMARFPGRDIELFFDTFFTSDGQRLIGVTSSGMLRTWDPQIGRVPQPDGKKNRVAGLSIETGAAE
ncbi:MAG: hypothetical protein EXS05_06200 [Planctomycetaceae bacterium]|nr:hypothetical protein [Planctomycetaceae bacterium]